MKYSYTFAQMREADRHTIEDLGVPSLTLMERAGAALKERALAAMKQTGAEEALVVCGGGNNGGDGFVAARLLQEEGAKVRVLCLAEKFSPDCEAMKKKYRGEILGRVPKMRFSFIVDCVLGTGLTREAEGVPAMLIDFINSCGAYVVSADLPSGLKENGVAGAHCVRADETVAMGLMKNALLLQDGADVAGKITIADIGIASADEGAEIWEAADVAASFPKRKSNVHKGTFGKACLLAGSMEYSGAAFLAASACLKSGAGYTRLCVPEELFPYTVGRYPACIVQPFRSIDGETLGSDCIAAGMGTGVSEGLFACLVELLPEYTGVLVLDADALNTIAHYGTEILKNKTCRVIVTPHPKEFSRLTGKSVAEIAQNAVAEAQSFAAEYGVTVLLKGNRTVITDGTRTAINTEGSPALAKGGSGDVLAGFLAGTCARGIPPFEACCSAAFVCGRAGALCAEEMGEYAPDAQDVIARLPRAIAGIAR